MCILSRAAIGLAGFLLIATTSQTSYGLAHSDFEHAADRTDGVALVAQMPMEGGMEGGMQMMRPDMAPPQGVMGGMSPRKGTLMVNLQYMYMHMEGNRDDTDNLSTSDVLAQYPVAPLDMDMNMLMVGAMYGVTDDISVMAMLPYTWKEMDHVTRTGVKFTTESEGVGDFRLVGGYDVYKTARDTIKLTAGLSFPTGSNNEKDDTPAGANQPLPYPMQIGSGTWDLLPGITYTGRLSEWSWGGQFGAVIRTGENDRDYTLGNIYQLSAWGARKWTDWLSSSLRLQGEIEEDIDGADPRLNPLVVPTADPELRAGKRLSIGLGLNLMVPKGPLRGVGFSIEGLIPVYQDLDGPQLERDYAILVGLRKAF